MKKNFNFKKAAAAAIVAAGVAGFTATVSGEEYVKIMGTGDEVLGAYPAASVSYIEFTEDYTPDPGIDPADLKSVEIALSDNVKFKMIKVEGGVDYTLTSTGTALTATAWAGGKATKRVEDFWIGEFQVTQGVWKEVMGITQFPTSGAGSSQSAVGNDYPMAYVSWNDISTGTDCFLVKINARLKELKASDPVLAAALGDREFRLPSEWEWEYAAAGGKDYADLKYYYSGTTGSTAAALQTVAVNSVSPNKATSVAEVGSKAPNALGLYDMSGNVYEWCSGLGYPGYENTPGYLKNDGTWESSNRPNRGGSWGYTDASIFRVSFRDYNTSSSRYFNLGFRLAL
ncbi:MAG: formylglycine-generating enzyme family protein [Bacteroidales bacterium]|nr:formylglycine-generating enzyme family protein [Bacteroidales bacterium]